MKTLRAACCVLLLSLTTVVALGPHELLVLVNANSQRSVEIAQAFARLRGVPETNLVYLAISRGNTVSVDMSPADFTAEVWQPATNAVAARGIGDHILAWIYSVDFPVRIRTEPPISIQGLTFLRNRLPDLNLAGKGLLLSPLFAGPDQHDAAGFNAQSLDVFNDWLRGDMPLPSMALGYAGARGNTKEQILKCLATGAASDKTKPAGRIYYIVTKDIRSTCRDWQFRTARAALLAAGVTSVQTNAFPSGKTDIAGLMMGDADVDPAKAGAYLPGCIADNLTSFGATFDAAAQTKVTAWIAAGATAAAGTITEPKSAWPKFPHGRLFVHEAAGCTVLEAYYQSIRCPLQLFIVGDPLASPWGRKAGVDIEGLNGQEEVSGPVAVRAVVASETDWARYVWLVDGRVVHRSVATGSYILDASSLRPGPHALRVVVYGYGMRRDQAFAEKSFRVRAGKGAGL